MVSIGVVCLQSICCCRPVHGLVCCCRPVHGLVFLFKWKDDDDMEGSVVQDSRLDSIFFAKQVNGIFFIVFNSCYVVFDCSL